MRKAPADIGLERLEAAVRRIATETSGRQARGVPDNQPITCTPEAFQLPKIYFWAPTATGDCCAASLPWGDLNIEDIIRRAATAHGPAELAVRYVNAADPSRCAAP
ncbi:MAG: hypothetical protein ACR2H3_05600 [Acidimicrobiales bacterium]